MVTALPGSCRQAYPVGEIRVGDCQRIAPMLRQPALSRDVPVTSGVVKGFGCRPDA